MLHFLAPVERYDVEIRIADDIFQERMEAMVHMGSVGYRRWLIAICRLPVVVVFNLLANHIQAVNFMENLELGQSVYPFRDPRIQVSETSG